MVRLISSDGMKDINYDAFALEIEENEDGLWRINAYANMVPTDEYLFYYTMSVSDTKEEALTELSSIRDEIMRCSDISACYIQLEDHLYGNLDNRNGE